MNIYEFINSKDIRAYCEKIGHTFNSMEAAFLIYQSQNHTLAEKHDAWKALIETMPDMVIEERLNCPRYKSLHDFLRQYMALENRLLTEFFQADRAWVYRFDPVIPLPWGKNYSKYDEKDFERVTGEQVYHSFSDGLVLEKEDWEDSPFFYVEKMRICSGPHEPSAIICVRIDRDGVPFEIDGLRNIMTDEENTLYDSFEGMWIDVPTPFQKGDIVCKNHQKLGRTPEPFVLTSLCTDKNTGSEWKRYERLLKRGDTTDMFACGHGLSKSYEEICHKDTADYLSLEYFRGDLGRNRRVLKVIQDFYHGELDVGDCMNAYHSILSEEYWKKDE